ncbi:PREDICTED: HAPLESS 2 [Prunus dulcis]|uniref:PREDICTED: HAPLESS 2 n=1 Tax=Prunus dulcis TaxID=3755 RepID=A0A5E4FW50_PRUDU|nr:PREDICTED: HAPLESS 2 [Prunus dulcis]
MVRFGLDGDVIGEAADGVGGLLVKAFLAPFKTTFGMFVQDPGISFALLSIYVSPIYWNC